MTLGEVAERLRADLTPPDGAVACDAGKISISGLAAIEQAGPAQIAFVANPKYAAAARYSRAAAIIVHHSFAPLPVATLRVSDPKFTFSQAVSLFHSAPAYPPGIHPTAVVGSGVHLGARPHLGPFAVVGDGCTLGDDAVLLAHAVLYPGVQAGSRLLVHAHAVVRENCLLGDDVTIGNGAVIGADGFGFARDPQGGWTRTLHPGPVVLEDQVEVQANSCIDRAILGETRIGHGTKIDNLVQIGHACSVGQNTLLCSQVGLAGSTRVGNDVILAGQVGVAGHLTIGDGAVATAQTGIPSDVAPGAVVSGYPAMDNRAWLRMVAALQRLPEFLRRSRTGGQA